MNSQDVLLFGIGDSVTAGTTRFAGSFSMRSPASCQGPGVKGSGVFFGNRVFKWMRRGPKKIPDPVRLRPTAALRYIEARLRAFSLPRISYAEVAEAVTASAQNPA